MYSQGSEDEAALFEAAQAVAELASTGNVSESCKGLRSIFKSLSTWCVAVTEISVEHAQAS